MFQRILLAGAAALTLAVPAFADITIEDAYARSAMPNAKTGAAFMIISNSGDADDRLLSVASDVAQRVELHTHIDNGQGMMQMVEVEEGFVIPAGGSHALQRGGDHVMFMGLTGPLVQGEAVTVTLTFEKAGDMVVEIPVDLERQPAPGGMGHGMKHGQGMAPKASN
ncbi:copper chaperone PCu(A)C [Thalassococcus sp. CAU 1522]|uniref:Copper chaperone PCu(A)C n=1 Tax=Thalassococcus arenae TaxID=2851652 RepID=A0ABS6N4C0_9RHOB|nr:copper chaperone PCu(A)C [Thalassococcus arenae]MBV2358502.1 copper chaperone PCu(A)C [Thalassococcus arenae]